MLRYRRSGRSSGHPRSGEVLDGEVLDTHKFANEAAVGVGDIGGDNVSAVDAV